MALYSIPASMRRWLGPFAWAAASLACGSTRLDDSLTDAPTRLRIEPDAFEGEVACVPGAQGALQSYVVTFAQVSFGALLAGVDAGALPLPVSSPPVPCNRATLFTGVGGQFYAADIVGFDREVSAEDVGQVEPAWSASCGRGTPDLPADAGPDPLGPTEAIFNYTVSMNGCTSFVRSGSAGELAGSLVIAQASALGQLQCGSGPGQVSRFEGVLGGTRVSAACGAPLTFPVQGAARFYTISLTAFEGGAPGADAGAIDALLDAGTPSLVEAALPDAATDAGVDAGITAPGGSVPDAGAGAGGASGGVARWRTQCIGRAVPGVSAVATCDPLALISP